MHLQQRLNLLFAPAHRLKRLLFLVVYLLTGLGAISAENNAGVSEYQLKGAFLYNFTKFIDWPTNAFPSPDAPLVIGIVGDDPFGKTMDDLVRNDVIRNHPLVIKRLRAGDDLRTCHILFISRSETRRLPQLLDQLKGSPVLTVGDMGGFAEQGGMINLQVMEKTMRLEINQTIATEAGLQISSKLLKLSRIVNQSRDPIKT